MGVYYHLLNDTKKKRVHLDSHVKRGPMTANSAVHYAFVNYMMQNQGDLLRLVSDASGEDEIEYEDLDLLSYEFDDPDVTPNIVSLLNDICGKQKYEIVDGGRARPCLGPNV